MSESHGVNTDDAQLRAEVERLKAWLYNANVATRANADHYKAEKKKLAAALGFNTATVTTMLKRIKELRAPATALAGKCFPTPGN